jgi:hypothetical protein
MNESISIEVGGAQLTVETKALFQAWLEKNLLAPKPPAVGLSIPPAKEGEKYAGAIIRPDGNGHHIFRTAMNFDGKEANWKTAMTYAQEHGLELPDRPEGALLHSVMKDDLPSEWHWTREQHAGSGDFAWAQYFGNGIQYGNHKSTEFRVVLVRRVPFNALTLQPA